MDGYEKENYVHEENYWEKYMPKVLLNHYKQYFKGKIGDFGCNSGLFDIHLTSMDTVEQVIGYDINNKAIEKANEFASNLTTDRSKKIEFLHKNLAENLEKEEYFDFVFSFHTLEHVYPKDVDGFVTNMFKTLKPGGFALINLPDKNSYLWEASHVFRPDKHELNALFEKHGFTVIESYEDERGGQTGASSNITALFQKKNK